MRKDVPLILLIVTVCSYWATVALLALLACLHLVAMNLKAGYEEQYLEASFGPPYREYGHRVGRFWPRAPRLTRRCT